MQISFTNSHTILCFKYTLLTLLLLLINNINNLFTN